MWLVYAGDYHKFVDEKDQSNHKIKKIIIHDKYDPWEYFSSYNLGKEKKSSNSYNNML